MKEFFDVVDENDNVIGKALRSDCHGNNKLIHRIVYVIAKKDGKILISKRSMKKDFSPGKWEVMGEHTKPGEDYKSAAIRGMKEEFGISVKVDYFRKIRLHSKEQSEFASIFTCELNNEKIKFDKNEITEIMFMTNDDILSIIKKSDMSPFSAKVYEFYLNNIDKTKNMEQVILVDKNDRQIGIMEKMETHKKAKLHRAFSVFIFDSKNRMLLQKRALDKYHCGGLWTNTCCSHPRPDEDVETAAHRRLKEEMGFDTTLQEMLSFVYKAPFENGLTEHEFDHIFFGFHDRVVKPDKKEVCEWEYVDLDVLVKDVKKNPSGYTPWFKMILGKVVEYIKNHKR